ncbi:ACP S-malonyltransferase [Streptosporangiaceae bacterium NEAU-GS5]|nr:ACP S-malonyltransferase [Streptosporangiaceae bacterium NEAU-GS5]
MLVIVAPGQGAQTPGFLSPWLEDSEFTDRLRWLSAVCGLDLAYLGAEADAETIGDTAATQPLLVAAGMLAAQALFPRPSDVGRRVDLAAGHSVGEITIAAITGLLSPEQAMVLVRERGRAMAAEAGRTESGMVAIVGGDAAAVLAAIERHDLIAVNDNGPGQIVAAGLRHDIGRLVADPPPGTRTFVLKVAGAFHTKQVQHVTDLLDGYLPALAPPDPVTRVLSNRDGAVVAGGRDALSRIAQQVSSPVYWNLCMDTMRDLGVTGMLELPPANTLTRIARRALPGVATFALNTPDQLGDAAAFIAAHGLGNQHITQEGAPTWPLSKKSVLHSPRS